MPENESIKFVVLNIEGNKRLPRVVEFLKKAEAEVFLLQEVFKKDVVSLAEKIGENYVFASMCRRVVSTEDENLGEWGVAIFSKYPILNRGIEYYGGDPGDLPELTINPKGTPSVIAARVLISVTIKKNNRAFNFATTHFTWTANGLVSDQQKEDLKKLMVLLDKKPDFLLAGDFNAPRGGEIQTSLAGKFEYWIPPHVKTTIDANLHRAGDLQLVVDHIYSKGDLTVENIVLTGGVSDHLAITGRVRV